MLEEKNDNLHNAEGQAVNPSDNTSNDNTSSSDTTTDAPGTGNIKMPHATEGQVVLMPEDEESTTQETSAGQLSDNNAETGELIGDAFVQENFAPTEAEYIGNITITEAVESTDASVDDEHEGTETAMDYQAMSMEELTDELQKLAAGDDIAAIKNQVENIRREFNSKYNHLLEEKKDEYSANNEGELAGFEFNSPVKAKFDNLYNQYRDSRNSHFKKMQSDLQGNLDKRLAIIDELKTVIDSGENFKDALKRVNDLRDRWKSAGPIPKDKYNHVWNNFHFHIERFYDHLHLDREARDVDFKHNLEHKQRLIARAEELVNEEDVLKAFRELQGLHKIWKEDIGPVSRDQREEIWNRFSELTKQLHDKREAMYEKLRAGETENLAVKHDIIAQIEAIANEKVTAHNGWQGQVDRVEALREKFFNAGKVPIEVNEDTWAAFKNAVRNFNAAKNSFYKDIKKDQNDNLNRKLALVEKAKSLQDSEDFEATTLVMKQIQDEWKTIGHVPRKYSDTVWKDFKAACNHYFDRLHAKRNEADSEELEAFEKKKEYLENLRSFELTGDHKTDLAAIKQHIENWKGLGRVPQARRHIEGKFNKILDALFDKLSLSKKETDMVKFSNRMEQFAEADDRRGIENEKIFIMRKIDEIQAEIFQLENNIQFFSNSKGDNPFIKEVNKNIERNREELKTWKDKLKQIRNMKQE